MSGFDYGNARLRAMKSRLLTRQEIESLAQSGDLQGILSGLMKTEYRKSVETALTHATGMNCLQEALHLHLVSILGKIQSFYRDEAGQAVLIVLQQYDVHNLKTILRGLAKNAPADEVLAGTLPVGELKPGLLAEIAKAPGLRGAIDFMASLNLPYAQPLIRLRGRHPGAEIMEMELALEQWFFQTAHARMDELRVETHWLAQALNLQADITNLLTILRIVRDPEERRVLQERIGENLQELFVGPGGLSLSDLKSFGGLNTLEALVEAVKRTPYAEPMHLGLTRYRQTGRFSEFERYLRLYRLNWMKSLFAKDPLGIGVPLGYLALKTSEVGNLRWIASQVDLGLPAGQILSELELIA